MSGGARGIGAAVALELAREGCAVAIGDLLEVQAEGVAQTIRGRGGRAHALALDVTDGASVAAAVASVGSTLGAVEVLVNCAGWDELKPFLQTDEQFWRRVIAINYEGILRTTHAVLAAMVERRWGRIVNVSSDAARVGSAQESVYAGAKAGVVAFTKTIARETATSGVTANVVCPGPTDTPLLGAMAEASPDARSGSSTRSGARCRCVAWERPRRWPPR